MKRRRSPKLPATSRPTHVVGVDVGATKIAAGVVRFPAGEIVSQRLIPTGAHRDSKEVLNDMADLMASLAAESTPRPVGVGIGICELVSRRGQINSAATLKWSSQQVRQKLRRFGPVTIEADVRAAALAEAMFGAGRKYGSFLFVSVGTGISCCLVLDGKPYLGAKGATGTMASATLEHTCEQCGHTRKESLEDISSGRGLAAQFNRVGGKASTAKDVFQSNSYAAMKVLEDGGAALGKTVALLVDVLDPAAVIVGGGVGLSKGIYWKRFIASTRAHIWSQVSRRVPIRRAETGPQAGVIGAAAAAWLARAPNHKRP